MHHSKGFSLLVCGVALLFSFKSHGLSSKELEAEVDRVSRVIEAQSQNLADAVNQVQSMTSEFQRMNGVLEKSMHTVDEQNATIRDSQRRLDVLEEKQALLIKQLEEIKVTGLLNPAQVKNLEDFKELEKGLTLVNAELIREGLGYLMIIPPCGLDKVSDLAEAHLQAQQQHLDLSQEEQATFSQ